jgi:hypothetical protein
LRLRLSMLFMRVLYHKLRGIASLGKRIFESFLRPISRPGRPGSGLLSGKIL